MDIESILLLIFQILYIVTVIGLIGVIISENRNPQKTICWILILIFLPVIGIVIYIFFGEDHRRINSMNKKLHKNLENLPEPQFKLHDTAEIDDKYLQLEELLKRINRASLIGGNKIDFYSDGKDKFRQFFIDIENAKEHVHILYYKIMDDKIGNQLKDLLIKKAKEGVQVRVIYDDVGSIKTKKRFFREMKEGGVEVEAFLPIRFPRIARRVNYRNHRKLAVIDGSIGYVGGMNVADCYIEGVKWGVWRDMHIRIEGQGVYGLQTTFILDWYYAHKENLNRAEYFPKVESKGNNPLQIVSSGPVDVYESITSGFFEAINCAKRYVYMQTPYFIPTDHIIKAMQVAAMSGVEVILVIPAKSDNAFVDAGTFSFVNDLIDANVKVYLYEKGFIHSKMFVIDDYLTVVGSANMDIRSFDLDFETCAFVYDEDTALKAKEIFMNDLKDSKFVVPEEWKNRPALRRLFESIMRLLTPLF
ncbi:MAG: cardiolipin synthase [Dysgonomonas sp.]